jgi:hypothetical protein
MKIIVLDSSSIITLAMNNLLYLLQRMKKFNVRFVITEDVKRETIERPLQIKKYELEALVIRQLVSGGIIEMPEDLGINSAETKNMKNKFMEIANSTFKADDEWMKIISDGEASCFALARLMLEKGMNVAIMIDERTARMLSEKPENLQRLFGNKLHRQIYAEKSNFSYFSGFKIIRSSELCYIAYKKGLVGVADGNQLVDALLYAVKFKGCAISGREIEQIKRLN